MILGILIALLLAAVAIVAAYIMLQGDAQLEFATDRRTQAVAVSASEERVDFQVQVPFKNIGKQEGTILDTFIRVYLPQEQYDGLQLRGKVNLDQVMREDDYFEAMLVPAGQGGKLLLRFEAVPCKGLTMAQALKSMPDVDVCLYTECRGRKELYTAKKYFTLTAEELGQLLEQYYVGK